MPAVHSEEPGTGMVDYKSLTNINDIKECLRNLDAEENAIDARLDRILDDKTRLEETIYQLSSMKYRIILTCFVVFFIKILTPQIY